MATLKSMFKLTDGYSKTIDKVMSKTDAASNKIMGASRSADNFNNKLNTMGTNANKASFGLGKLVGTVVSLAAVQKTLNFTDEMTQTSARLDLINDGLQTTKELQDKIFAAAKRSRGEYTSMASTVSKLGLLAGEAFNNNNEIIAFAETFQKMATVSGSSLSESTNAMYQLTQAMASGRLQGDEFRSIMENAPMLAKSIADSLGVTTGELRIMASEGLITSQVIKNAMFNAADEVNAKFANMPMTYGQAWNIIKNSMLQSFLPIIQTIAKGAQWIGNNWERLIPIFYGAATAVTAYGVGLGIMKIATIQAKIANDGLKATLLSNPLMWIALLIGVVIAAIAKWVQSVGGISIAWMIAKDKILSAWDMIGIGVMTGVYAITDFMGYMKVAVLSELQSMVNDSIDIINGFIKALNKIPGVALGTLEHMTFGATAKLEYEADKRGRADALKNLKYDAKLNSSMRKFEIDIAKQQAAVDKATGFDFNDPMLVEGTGANGSVNVSMDDSDLKYIREMAEREYINKFSTATLAPQIQMKFGDIRETADANKVAGIIERLLSEEIAVVAEG